MPAFRVLVPLIAAAVVASLVAVIAVALKSPKPIAATNNAATTQFDDISDLIALKKKAEALAIEGKLKEANEVYNDLLIKGQGRKLSGINWDLLENAQSAQRQIYTILLAQNTPATRAAPTATTTRTSPVMQPSFVETHPPYSAFNQATTRTTTKPSTTQDSALSTQDLAKDIPPLPQPKRFKVERRDPDPDGFSDPMVGYSLRAGASFLMAQFKDDEIPLGSDISPAYQQGLNALAVYALLSAGEALQDKNLSPTSPAMSRLIERMKQHPMMTHRDRPQNPVTYARSIRAQVLALANRPEDRDLLKDDVQWLINAAVEGAYTYDDRHAALPFVPADPKAAPKQHQKPPTPLDPRQPDPRKPRRLSDQTGMLPTPGDTCDFRHDPRTGAELDPRARGGPRIFLPPPPPSMYTGPQELPEPDANSFRWDNSNSHFAMLGVYAGSQAGIEIPDSYWAAVQNHWLACQDPDGQFPYRRDKPGGYFAMNCAGIASLLITADWLESPMIGRTNKTATPASKALGKSFAWLENLDNPVTVTGKRTIYLGYNLHGLSRVGLLSGYKHLGMHDWYRDLAKKVVLSQWQNGSWGRTDQATPDTVIDTAFTMLFLARARHPVIMNKLRLDNVSKNPLDLPNHWNNRPRDLANLSRFASRELERPVNWQIVSINHAPEEWADAPILYFASHQAVRLDDEHLAKLRAYIEAGGMLFTQADDGAASFNTFADQLAKRLFPEYEFKYLPADHEIYTLQYQIEKKDRPRLRAVRSPTRLLWVHSPADLGLHWQQRADKTQTAAFQMGVNLFVYAGGKTNLRNRLETRAIPQPDFKPSYSIPVARLSYNGDWNPEPAAFERFARHFQWETGVAITPKTVRIADLDNSYRIAHMSGVGAYIPPDPLMISLRQFVQNGGVLVVESVGPADAPFAESLQSTILPQAFPGAKFEALPKEHPMLNATFEGMEDVYNFSMRPYAIAKLGQKPPPLREAVFGKGKIIYVPLDMTSGLLGTNTWGILGYTPGEATAVLKNIILHTLETMP